MDAIENDPQVKALEDKVAQNPNDTDSLLALARGYARLGEENKSSGYFVKSAGYYNTLVQLKPQDASLWADFADVQAMVSGGVLAGHPTMMINKALALDPNNPKAIALAGAAAMERGDYAVSIKYWEKLKAIVPPGSEDAQMVDNAIKQARDALARGDRPAPVQPGMQGDNLSADMGSAPPMMGGGAPPMMGGGGMGGDQEPVVSSGKERITGTVTLSPALKSKVKAGDTLFVVAVAESGPPMPLAVMRVQASDLPLKFSLDDTMSMAPQLRLSNFDRVVVKARITSSGQPMAQPGDLQGVSATLKPGTNGVNLTIDTVVK
jgi:cytochrome c-type biogenesis protein CcmH